MAAWELLGAPTYGPSEEGASGIAWLLHLREHYDRAVWLNPEPPRSWAGNTIETIASIFPMFPLTLDGLSDGVTELVRGSSPRR